MMVMILSCKSDEVSPADMFVGAYDQYTGSGPDKNGDFEMNGTTVVITKTSNQTVSVTLNGVILNARGELKDLFFPECEITNIDTTGLGIYWKKYARIVDKKNNIELCQISNLILPINGIKGPDLVRVRLDVAFLTEDGIRINLIGVKRKD